MPTPRLAESHQIEDTSRKIFGRAADIALLMERTQFRGVTAVVGIPQIGKSTLLAEVEDRLAISGWPGQTHNGNALCLQGTPPLVGLVKSSPEYANTLRRAVENLYTRWIEEASYPEQAQVVFENERKNWIVRTGQTVGSLFESLGKAHGSAGAAIGTAVRGVFDTLAQANQNLTNPGSQLPRLEVEDSRELLRLACEVSKRPAVLLFDAWEASPDPIKEVGMLRAFVDEIDDWPSCHIVLGLTPGDHAKGLRHLGRHPSGVVLVHDLQPMNMADASARDPLLAYIRSEVPAARECTAEDLLGLMGGHPGVLARWTSDYGRERFHTPTDLIQAAQDACNYSYPEFEELLPKLTADEKTVAMRLLWLPAFSNAADWKALEPVVLKGNEATLLDDLLEKGVLEYDVPPTYGHAKRAEAARAYFAAKRRQGLKQAGESLVSSLAAEIRDTEPRILPLANSLVHMRPLAVEGELSAVALALCESAYSLYELPGLQTQRFLGLPWDGLDTPILPLLAMGLYNTLIYAKQENDLERRDALLGELRELSQANPGEAAVREQLAKGLYNTLNDAKQENDLERRDALLGELRELSQAHPGEAAVREQLAKGLNNTLIDAKQENDLERRDALLGELRELSQAHPGEVAVRERLANGLYNTLIDAKQENDLERRDALLGELRELSQAHPGEAAVRERLAKGLYNTLIDAKQENDLERRDALLGELRELSQAHPGEAAVRERLAKGLYNTLIYAKQENDLERRDALLGELRELSQANPGEAAVRERLAKGLNNTLNDAKQENDLERRDALLGELRELSQAHPGEAAVRENLSMGLLNTLVYAKQENDLERRHALLGELQTLIQNNPDDPFLTTEIIPRLVQMISDEEPA